MAKSRVLYGPQGSGKTMHAHAIAKSLGLQHFMDLDDLRLRGHDLRANGYLYLSCLLPEAEDAATLLRTPLLHISEVLSSMAVTHD